MVFFCSCTAKVESATAGACEPNPTIVSHIVCVVAEAWGKGRLSYLSIRMFRTSPHSSYGYSADTARLDVVHPPPLPAGTGSVRDRVTFWVLKSEVLAALPSIWKLLMTQITGAVDSSIEPRMNKRARGQSDESRALIQSLT